MGVVMLYVDLFESEAIAKFAYDLNAASLVIFFKSGGVYQYANVPRETFDGLRAAESKGQFFQSAIRPRFTGRALSASEIATLEASPAASAAGGEGHQVVLVEIARLERADGTPVFF